MNLIAENHRWQGSPGVSTHNAGMQPAFRDRATRTVYLSRFADGRLAPCHLLVGLPNAVFLDPSRQRVKRTLVAGFVYHGDFYTRAQAARIMTRNGSF